MTQRDPRFIRRMPGVGPAGPSSPGAPRADPVQRPPTQRDPRVHLAGDSVQRGARAPRPGATSLEPSVAPKKLLAEIERLLAERDAAVEAKERTERERDEYLGALQRERAEFLNFKRRTADEREAMLGLAAEGLIGKVLALADDFDRAVETRPDAIAADPWVEGIAAIDRKLRQLLESEGVSQIEASPGTPFDPREHEAVANVPATDRYEGEIVEELRRGYRLRDRVIRPALVAVAVTPDMNADDASSDTREPIH